jgi:hypothetical protein
VLLVLLGLIRAEIARRKGYALIAFWVFGVPLFIVALAVALLIKPSTRYREQGAARLERQPPSPTAGNPFSNEPALPCGP